MSKPGHIDSIQNMISYSGVNVANTITMSAWRRLANHSSRKHISRTNRGLIFNMPQGPENFISY